jgi:hypothetical protein
MAAANFVCTEGTFRVTGDCSTASRFEGLREGQLTPVVGLTEELVLLMRWWKQARSGTGRVVFVSGEPGTGESRSRRLFRTRRRRGQPERDKLQALPDPTNAGPHETTLNSI